MRDALAEKVLARVVDWDAERLAAERLGLELLSEVKYDEYGQFSPGMRFVESLSLWLGQFEAADRDAMYGLVRDRLVFVSNAETRHFIRMAYADHIKPILVAEAARRAGTCAHLVARITGGKEFEDLQKKCLYLGLSDGARMDDLRRTSNLRHEQVYSLYEIADLRRDKMMKNLEESVGADMAQPKFEIVFLVDDFSASGLSYARKEDGKFKGKIRAFLDQFAKGGGGSVEGQPEGGGLDDMFAEDLLVVVLLYTATDRAVAHIEELAADLLEGHGIRLKVVAVNEIREADASVPRQKMDAVERILEEKFDDAVLTASYKTGRHDKPHLGFDECGLLVVLSHNCPNNTLPIIWHESDGPGARALFPRHQRFGGG